MNRNPSRPFSLPYYFSSDSIQLGTKNKQTTVAQHRHRHRNRRPYKARTRKSLARIHHVPRNSLELRSFPFVPSQLSAQDVFFDDLLQSLEVVKHNPQSTFSSGHVGITKPFTKWTIESLVTSWSETSDMALGASVRECNMHEKSCEWVKRYRSSTSGVFSN